jgi:hypothetical protein
MKTREWMKASPFGNAQAREKILQEAMDKVKAGRSRNIQKLRTGEQNLSELAREILNDTMSVTVPHKASPDSVAALSLPVVRASVADDAINVVFDARADVDAVATDVEVMEDGASRSSVDGNNSSSRSSSNSSSSSSSSGSSSSGNVGGVGVGPPAYCWDEDEAELIRFLGTDEHQLLMEEIAEAMKAEYGDYEADQLFGDDVGASAAVDWSQAEEEATGRYVICPVCRSASMEIDGPAGKCSCGALVNLRHGAGGDVLSVDQFRDLLAAVFDRYVGGTGRGMRTWLDSFPP